VAVVLHRAIRLPASLGQRSGIRRRAHLLRLRMMCPLDPSFRPLRLLFA
jgi:hypothetical protein